MLVLVDGHPQARLHYPKLSHGMPCGIFCNTTVLGRARVSVIVHKLGYSFNVIQRNVFCGKALPVTHVVFGSASARTRIVDGHLQARVHYS